MSFLSKEDILQSQDREIREVEAWGGTVRLMGWTGAQRDKFTKMIQKRRFGKGEGDVDVAELKPIMAQMSIVDGAGEPMFTRDEVKALNEKSSAELDKVVEVIREMNGLTKDAVEDAEKNS